MNKKLLTEADIRTKFITPAIIGVHGDKWNVMTQLQEERYITKGRVIVRGKVVTRGEARKVDYLLFYCAWPFGSAWSGLQHPSLFFSSRNLSHLRAGNGVRTDKGHKREWVGKPGRVQS